jgi:glycosyltransferase involved in cell wall biosynthesis
VHFHGFDFLEYMPTQGLPVLVTLHLPPHLYPRKTFQLPPREARLICVSEAQARACPPHAPVFQVVDNGVALDRYYPEPKKDNYLVALGRICPEKRFDLALDAASAAGVPLQIAGEVFPYASHEQFFRQAIQPRLRDQHRFLGAVAGERKRRLLAGARALLVPSRIQETSSLVTMEALACGTPVIAFRSGALPDLIAHGRTGFIVDDRRQMTEAIRHVDELDPRECRMTAETCFSAEAMIRNYFDIYGSMVSTSRHHQTLMR